MYTISREDKHMKTLTVKKFPRKILLLAALALCAGCAGHRNLADKKLDVPRWTATFKQLNGDYAAAGDAEARNAALEGFRELAAKSPSKASAELVKQSLCPLALSEGRADILEGECANSKITKALLGR